MQELLTEGDRPHVENKVRVKSRIASDKPPKLTYDYKHNQLSHALEVANKARGFKS